MFGLFKKNKAAQERSSKTNGFQPFFATRWVHNALSTAIGGFSGAVLCNDGAKVISNAWRGLWSSNLPGEPMLEPEGLEVKYFYEGPGLVVFISFPACVRDGDAHAGVAVIGPCSDPEWGPDSRQNLAFRYFVLLRTGAGTAIEEWTAGSAIPLGTGPEPAPELFVEWVLNHTVRATGEVSISIRGDDAEMHSAMEQARSTLPEMLQRFVSGEFRDAKFTVKVRVKDGEAVEYFWLTETSFQDGRFSGTIEAEPRGVSNVKPGDRWTATTDDVVDWMYARDQKMHGNYTLRAMLPNLPPDQAAKYRALLAPLES